MSTPARLFAIASSVFAMLVVAPAAAMADSPATWEEYPAGHDGWGYLLLLVGIPVGLAIVIWILTLPTARRNYVPPKPGTDVVPSNSSVDHH